MADKKKSGISVMPEFVDGEQPSAQKFNSIGAQVKASDYNLELSIGDIWDESYPYSGISNKTLSLNKIKSNAAGTEYIDTNSAGSRLDIASLGRLIGPASNLNPITLSYDQNGPLSKTVTDERINGTGGNEYTFVYLPYGGTSLVFTNTTVFANSVASLNSLSSAGDYYVDFSKGAVYTFSPISSTCYVSYSTRPVSYEGGGSPIGATFNVIPDPAQVNLSGNQLTLTLEADGSYLVVLPNSTHEAANRIGNTTLLDSSRDINAGVKLTLPLAVTLACSSGQYALQIGVDTGVPGTIIPEGIIHLKNETTLEAYTEATYYYVNNYSFKIKTSEILDIVNDKFSVITVGNNITSCIQDLSRKHFFHSHSREFGESLIKAEDIGENYKHPGESGSFIPSNVRNNYFSQYLHRDGSRGDDTGLNDDNAMRGNLVIGRAKDINNNDITEAGSYLGEGSSFYLNFGGNSASDARIGKYYNTTSNEGLLQIQSGINNSIQAYSPNEIQLFSTSSNTNAVQLLAPSGYINIDGGTAVITETPINIITATDEKSAYNQSVHGMALGDYNTVRSFWNPSFDSVSANGVWYTPQLKTVSYREIGMRFLGRKYSNGDFATTLTDADYWEGVIDIPLGLSHGPNPSLANSVNVQSPAVILPHMISCVLRKTDSALNSGSWMNVNSTAFINGQHDFYNHSSNISVGDHKLAHTYGYLEGSAYNAGHLKYKILIDADELGGLANNASMNEFERHSGGMNVTITPSEVRAEIDVILTIWYMQGEYP